MVEEAIEGNARMLDPQQGELEAGRDGHGRPARLRGHFQIGDHDRDFALGVGLGCGGNGLGHDHPWLLCEAEAAVEAGGRLVGVADQKHELGHAPGERPILCPGNQASAAAASAPGRIDRESVDPGPMSVMADLDAAGEALALEGEDKLAVGRVPYEGNLARRIVMRPQDVARPPEGNDGVEVFVAIGPEDKAHGSTGVSPGRPHSAQEPS